MPVVLLLPHLKCARTLQDFPGQQKKLITKLHQIMVDIFHKVDDASKRYDMEGNYVAGANIAGFEKVVDAMIAQGIV